MVRVVSLLPQSRFEQSQTALPPSLSVDFLTDYHPEAIIAAAAEAEALFMPPSHPHLDANLLSRIPSVRMIQTAGAGFDSVDHRAAAEQGIVVCNSPAQNATTVAEHVLGVIVALQRELAYADATIKAGAYSQARESVLARGCLEIFDSTVGIVGLGAIGRKLAVYLQTMGATVIAHDVFWPQAFAEPRGIRSVSLNELFTSSDIISLHCPLTDDTRNLVNAPRLASMKPSAILVNAARGGVVNEADLAYALEQGFIRGAAIDNFADEIPQADNPLLTLSEQARRRILFTPHLAGVTKAAFARMLRQGMDNLVDALIRGQEPRFSVNGLTRLRQAH